MAQTANTTLQYSLYVACSCNGAVNYTPGFEYKAVAVALGATGVKPLYISLAGTASTSTFMLSTGQQIFWSPIPSVSNTFGVYCTACGSEFSLNLFG